VFSAYDGCLRSTPIAWDCYGSRAEKYEALGRCKEMEEDFRRVLSGNPNVNSDFYDGRARALYALGFPRQTVLEALLQKWTQVPPEKRRAIELLDRARLDFDAGSFGEAEAGVRAAGDLI
jgi:tetratricopeptide (TPR) repeat protein